MQMVVAIIQAITCILQVVALVFLYLFWRFIHDKMED